MPDEISLRDYVELHILRLEDRMNAHTEFDDQRDKLNQLAIKKAEDSMTDKLATMNEFRGQMRDERGNFATRDSLVGIDSRLKELERSSAFASGRIWMFMALFSLIPTVIAIVAFCT